MFVQRLITSIELIIAYSSTLVFSMTELVKLLESLRYDPVFELLLIACQYKKTCCIVGRGLPKGKLTNARVISCFSS